MTPCRLLFLGWLFAVATTGVGICGAATEGPRTRLRLSEDWAFHLGEASGAENPFFDDSKWRRLDVPHDWSIEQPYDPKMPGGSSVGYLPGGIGWYRKSFTLPESDKGKEIVIDFDGVYMDSQVWINGHLLGKRPNGYVGFRYDLTPYLKYGSEPNHIAVRANVEPSGSRWYPGAGIYRNVWLVKMNPIHVAHWGTAVTTPEVTKEKATVRLRTEVENKSAEASEVKLTSVILDQKGNEVAKAESKQRIAAGGMQEFDQQFVVAKPLLWSPDSPDLYQVVSTVQAGGKNLDQYTTTLGIRTCEFTADRGFLLNGERVDIKGVCMHHDFGALGTAVSEAALQRQLEILREMGCNAIRTSHNPREPEFYAMCDRMGFMVMDEAFDVWEQKKLGNDYHKYFKEWHERDLTSMVRRDRNHPCVILWSVGNEVNEQHKEDYPGQGGVIAKRLVEICKQHDPSRAVTAACNSPEACEKNGITAALDVYGQNYQLNAYPELKGKKPIIGTENATNFATRDSYSFEVVNDRGMKLSPQNTKNSIECTGYGTFWQNDRTESTLRTLRNSPWVAGQFAWTGFDYLGECFPFHWPARNGLFGIMDTAGFPKDTYGIYQADWTDKPSVQIVPKNWNWQQFNGVPIPVKVYTNCDEVELILNNNSLGVKPINRAEGVHAEWLVNYQPGELKAVGRKDGQQVCTDIVKTAGRPARLELLPDHSEIAADGEDLSFVEVRLVDKDGTINRDEDRKLSISLTGEGTLVGVDNGSATNHAPFEGNEIQTFYGRALVIVKSNRQPGSILLKILTDGLEDAQVAISTLSPVDAKLTEAAARREKDFREKNKTHSRHRIAKVKESATTSPVVQSQSLQEVGNPAATGTLTVAPIFKHGTGQHTDSVVASRNKKPPTWSEKDARILIAEEGKRHGVEFVLEGSLPRVEGIRASRDGKATSVQSDTAERPMPLVFDGVTKTGKIAFEILTTDDVPDRIDNTDQLTDLFTSAQRLAEELKAKSGVFVVGVFYDPLAGKGEIADQEPLRQQVRDFIAWLKTEKHVP
jgi:beta-galactosidase